MYLSWLFIYIYIYIFVCVCVCVFCLYFLMFKKSLSWFVPHLTLSIKPSTSLTEHPAMYVGSGIRGLGLGL